MSLPVAIGLPRPRAGALARLAWLSLPAIATLALAAQDGGSIDALVQQLPGKRMGRPEDIARAVVWLCSDDAAYVSGDTMVVDGGLMAH